MGSNQWKDLDHGGTYGWNEGIYSLVASNNGGGWFSGVATSEPSAQQKNMYWGADMTATISSTLISTFMGGYAGSGLSGSLSMGRAFGSYSGRVFWSGGDLAKNAAAEFAKANGMKTLEMTTRGRIMNTLSPYLPRSVSAPIWDKLSGNFARGATGEINVFQNAAGVSLKSTWKRIEYPILRNNNIIHHTVK